MPLVRLSSDSSARRALDPLLERGRLVRKCEWYCYGVLTQAYLRSPHHSWRLAFVFIWHRPQGDGWDLKAVERARGTRGLSVRPWRWVVERGFAWLTLPTAGQGLRAQGTVERDAHRAGGDSLGAPPPGWPFDAQPNAIHDLVRPSHGSRALDVRELTPNALSVAQPPRFPRASSAPIHQMEGINRCVTLAQ